MTISDFKASLKTDAVPAGLTPLLQALWYDGKGDWERAHTIAQEIHTNNGSWIHAYLHRKEGDSGNASYWYHMADKPYPTIGLQEEWDALVNVFLNEPKVARVNALT
jgi:hypothetical protein